MTIPPFLKPGDTIAVTCPAGYMPAEKAAECIETIRREGFQVVVGSTVGSASQNYFSGTDEERLAELQAFLDDKKINAILCARGGYGTGRIIEKIDFGKFLKHPKWLIGFSDVTVLHAHVYSNFKIASLHAPMAAAFNEGGSDDQYTKSLFTALRGKPANYMTPPRLLNRFGTAKGKLIGGNLSLLAHLSGTSSDMKTKNCILFLEDVGEYLYNADRMLCQLKRNGKFEHLAGLIIGGFTDMKDTERPFGKTIDQVFGELTEEYDFPVCYGFPVSHVKENVALKIGVKHKLTVNETGSFLQEM